MEILTIESLSFSYPQRVTDKTVTTKAGSVTETPVVSYPGSIAVPDHSAASVTAFKALDNISFTVEQGDFVAICGATGSGKSTLLHMLKPELRPLGEAAGQVKYRGIPLEQLNSQTSAGQIGFVMQRPEQQIVTDKVWHELAFGLENMHLSTAVIRRRTAEMACYFGIENWFDKNISELSGGQKQLLNLASVMVMQPDVLILDEPTSQLDPIAAGDFIATLARLNRELALTVIIVEHRLEEIIPIANKILALANGQLKAYGATRTITEKLRSDPDLLVSMPAAMRLYCCFNLAVPCPLTVSEGRSFIETNFDNKVRSLPSASYQQTASPALEFSNAYFRYGRDLPDVLRGLTFTVYQQEIFCILGGNGSGKTTALSAAAGLNKIYSGTIKVFNQKLKDYKNQTLYRHCLTLLPQDVQTIFLKNTVREELLENKPSDSRSQKTVSRPRPSSETQEANHTSEAAAIGTIAAVLADDLAPLLDQHPYDLSGGQQQLVALAKVLNTAPRLLLLDEPTKGLDAKAKINITNVLQKLKAAGMTILIVTHDIEFAAACADRCALFFRGEIAACDIPRRFFAANNFYTTAANRLTRGYYDDVVTVAEAAALCRLNQRKG